MIILSHTHTHKYTHSYICSCRCLPCKQLEPHFLAAARRLINHDPPIQLGSLDVVKNIDTTKKFGLQKYPHLIIFRYGEAYNYTGPKEENGTFKYKILFT